MGKGKGAGAGATIGGVIAAIDGAIFRSQPPAHEMVHHARPNDPVPAGDGGDLEIRFPDPPTSEPIDEHGESRQHRSRTGAGQ